MNNSTTRDAEEFGIHVKQGGWRLGLLVARNVIKGVGDRSRSRNDRNAIIDGKVSAREFARMSGTSAPRVLRYLDAWEAAAEAGYVPPVSALAPGEEVDLDVDALPDWADFYPPGDSNYRGTSVDRRAAIDEAANRYGASPSQVARAAASAPAVAAAIEADPRVANAARRALDAGYERERAARPERDVADFDKPLILISELHKIHTVIDRVARLIADGKAVVGDGERDALLEVVDWLINALGHIRSGIKSDSLDVELARLLEDRS